MAIVISFFFFFNYVCSSYLNNGQFYWLRNVQKVGEHR